MASRNAERAGLAAHVSFAVASVEEVAPPPGCGPGLVLCNPPYGRRLGERRGLAPLYAALGRTLRQRFRGWRAGILHQRARADARDRLRPGQEHRLTNGGVRVVLYVCAT